VIESIISKVTGYLRNTAERYVRDAAYPCRRFGSPSTAWTSPS